MTIKLIAIDVDDTLLSSKQELLDSTIEVIQQALTKSIKVVLCTGRPLAGVTHFLAQLGIEGSNQYVITFNGAVIETVTGEVVAKHLLDNATYRALTAFAEKKGIPFNVLDEHSSIYTASHDVNWVTVVQAYENLAGIYVRTPDEQSADFSIAKGLFIGEAEQLDLVENEVRSTFSPDFYVVRSGRNFLEVLNQHVNKGQALKDLAAKLGLESAEVMAIGDEQNDIPMFDFAGIAIAMGNCSELAKDHATYITSTNDADGIAEAVRKFVLTD